MKWLSVVSLALALSASALAADEKESPYYPMRDGATWTYKSGDSKFTVKVVKHETVQRLLAEPDEDANSLSANEFLERAYGETATLLSGPTQTVLPPPWVLRTWSSVHRNPKELHACCCDSPRFFDRSSGWARARFRHVTRGRDCRSGCWSPAAGCVKTCVLKQPRPLRLA